jgi:hypothetical protein
VAEANSRNHDPEHNRNRYRENGHDKSASHTGHFTPYI